MSLALQRAALPLHEVAHLAAAPGLIGRLDEHHGFFIGAGFDSSDAESLDSLVGAVVLDYVVYGGTSSRLFDILNWSVRSGPNPHDARLALSLINVLSVEEATLPVQSAFKRARRLVDKAATDSAWLTGLTAAYDGLRAGDGLVIGEGFTVTPMPVEQWLDTHRLPPWKLLKVALEMPLG